MKLLSLISVFLFCSLTAQKISALDSLKLKEAKDLLADDYGNLYIYKNKDFSFTKYDSLGKQMGKIMFTVPFKIQSAQNPLSIPFFSENAQELKFFDQNLNEIQKVDFRQKFGFIKLAYAEDLQQLWLLDESSKRLIQYNFRNDTTINSYPFDMNFDEMVDLLVFENKVYILTKKHFRVFTFKFEKIFEAEFQKGKRFRRENDVILVITDNSIVRYVPEKGLIPVFEDEAAQIVDKNTLSYFEVRANKLYLYSLEEIKKKVQEQLNSQEEGRQNPEDLPKAKIEKIMDEIKALGF